MSKTCFPKFQKQLSDFLRDEEGAIPRSRIVSVGTMILLLTMFYPDESFAKHKSHVSHRDHASHRSHRNSVSQESKTLTPTSTPGPSTETVGVPSMPETNGAAGHGFSAAPVKGENTDIVLSRLSNNEEVSNVSVSVPASASSGIASGIEALIKANGGDLPEVSVGMSPASPGTLPILAGELMPGAAQVDFNMETVNHHFDPFVNSVEYSTPSLPTGKPVKTGIIPKDPGMPVK